MAASRHRPRHAAVPVREKRRERPGVVAMLRSHPGVARKAAVGAIAAGVALFVVAAVLGTSATAESHPTARHVALPLPAGSPTAMTWAHPSATTAIHAVDAAHIGAAPRTVRARHTRKAPATPKVISGLAANGIPSVALNAYRVAATRMANADPSCGIDWALLAGIGREESDHGQFGGAVLDTDGTSTPRIIGPALDGVHWDYVPAPPDGLQLDGDATYAHALGPMQFIPQTWASYGVDANGDGIADVFNINDAALGAARYLCAAGGDLRTHSGQVAAILAYNHSDAYLAQVLALAAAYRAGIPITGIPVGIVHGKLPPVAKHPTLPVNPGGPTANDPRGHKKHTTTHRTRTRHRHGTRSSTSPSGSGGGTSGGSPGRTRSRSTSPAPVTSPSRHTSHSPSPSPSGTSPSPTQTPSPTPTPTPTCQLSLGDQCVLP